MTLRTMENIGKLLGLAFEKEEKKNVEKMKLRRITIKRDVSLLVESIINIIKDRIDMELPKPNAHGVEVGVTSVNNSWYIFDFWATDSQMSDIEKVINSIYDLGE